MKDIAVTLVCQYTMTESLVKEKQVSFRYSKWMAVLCKKKNCNCATSIKRWV